MQSNEVIVPGTGPQELTFADTALRAVWLDAASPTLKIVSPSRQLVRATFAGGVAAVEAPSRGNQNNLWEVKHHLAPAAFARLAGHEFPVNITSADELSPAELRLVQQQPIQTVSDELCAHVMTYLKKARAAGGSAAEAELAGNVLFTVCRPRVVKYLRSRCPNDLVDDITNGALMNVWEKANTWEPPDPGDRPPPFQPWLNRIAFHLWVDYLRGSMVVDFIALALECKKMDNRHWTLISAAFFDNLEEIAADLRQGYMPECSREQVASRILRWPAHLRVLADELSVPVARYRRICKNFISAVCISREVPTDEFSNFIPSAANLAADSDKADAFVHALLGQLRRQEPVNRCALALSFFGIGLLYHLEMDAHCSGNAIVQAISRLQPKCRSTLHEKHWAYILQLPRERRIASIILLYLSIAALLDSLGETLAGRNDAALVVPYLVAVAKAWNPEFRDVAEEDVNHGAPQSPASDTLLAQLHAALQFVTKAPEVELASILAPTREAAKTVVNALVTEVQTRPGHANVVAIHIGDSDDADALLAELQAVVAHPAQIRVESSPQLCRQVLEHFWSNGPNLPAQNKGSATHSDLAEDIASRCEAEMFIAKAIESGAAKHAPSRDVVDYIVELLGRPAISAAAMQTLVNRSPAWRTGAIPKFLAQVLIAFRDPHDLVSRFRERWRSLGIERKQVIACRYFPERDANDPLLVWLTGSEGHLSEKLTKDLVETLMSRYTDARQKKCRAIHPEADDVIDEFLTSLCRDLAVV